jgi:hypothetical protein
MKAFYQKELLKRMDCSLVYKEDQKNFMKEIGCQSAFILKDNPREVAASLATAKTIHVHPDGFDYWIDVLEVLHERKQGGLPVRLFVFSGSDYPIKREHIEYWAEVFPHARFWIQNFCGIHPQCEHLPIGVNSLFDIDTSSEKSEDLVITFFTATNSEERNVLRKYLQSNQIFHPYVKALKPIPEYLEDLGCAKFSLCSRGNGYDTIRFWESLARGAIPLVLLTEFYESLLEEYPTLPFVVLPSWDTLPYWLEGQLQTDAYPSYKPFLQTIPILTLDYWLTRLRDILDSPLETSEPNTSA